MRIKITQQKYIFYFSKTTASYQIDNIICANLYIHPY
jgi:hypothetical protein